jgi:hypothetical protein
MKKKTRKHSHHKLLQAEIKLLEQEYYDRLNAEIPQWQQNQYTN